VIALSGWQANSTSPTRNAVQAVQSLNLPALYQQLGGAQIAAAPLPAPTGLALAPAAGPLLVGGGLASGAFGPLVVGGGLAALLTTGIILSNDDDQPRRTSVIPGNNDLPLSP
jgi:hypothetical protein